MYTIVSPDNRNVGTLDHVNGRITTDSPALKQIVDLWASTGIRIHVTPKQKAKPDVMLDGVKIVKLGPNTAHIFALELQMLGYSLDEEKSDPTKSSAKEQEGMTVGDLLSAGDNRPREKGPIEEAMEPFKVSDGEKLQDPPVTQITDGGVFTRTRKKPTVQVTPETKREE